MIGGLPWYILVLVAALLAALLGMLSAFAETRAVHSMKRWPFRIGVPVVRFRESPSFFPQGNKTTVTRSAELRVVSAAELLFVAQGWRSHVSWSFSPQRTSPYALKGVAVLGHQGTEIVGRISLAASLGVPGMMIWLGGCASLAFREHPGMGAILFIAGILLPAGLTWATLPAEIERFRGLWQEVRELLAKAPGPSAE